MKKFTNNSRTYRRIMNELKKAANKAKMEHRKKYDKKVDHLRNKYKREEEDQLGKVPMGLERFANLSIFNEEKYEEIMISEQEVTSLGAVKLSDEEKAVLQLHTKFAIVEDLSATSFNFEKELSYAKIRLELRKEDEENEKIKKKAPFLEVIEIEAKDKKDEKLKRKEDRIEPEMNEEQKKEIEEMIGEVEEEEKRRDEEDARKRQTFDPVKKEFDDRKRRVTDLKECARVVLPKPLKITEE